jgi:hypothetical protein
MPYIPQNERTKFEPNACVADTPGQLNYQVTRLVDAYIAAHGLNYTAVNQVVGALECAKLELYRRIAAPYEDQKCYDNGDAYDTNL